MTSEKNDKKDKIDFVNLLEDSYVPQHRGIHKLCS